MKVKIIIVDLKNGFFQRGKGEKRRQHLAGTNVKRILLVKYGFGSNIH